MINLEMSPETAVSVLNLICEEEKKYGQQYVPVRVEHLRALLPQIDEKLTEYFMSEREDVSETD